VPKKDRCDTCMEFQAGTESAGTVTQALLDKYSNHTKDKNLTRTEREQDRQSKETTVICFDLQHVLTCPRANVSSFFYMRKLNVFNLTAHCSVNKKAYNAIWSESLAGRGGNELASALVAILDAITSDHPNITDIVLWSDSCD
jgi:hypothetical protein